jgi:hypothetical protein
MLKSIDILDQAENIWMGQTLAYFATTFGTKKKSFMTLTLNFKSRNFFFITHVIAKLTNVYIVMC